MNINLYLELLKDELDTLWDQGVNTWDAAAEDYFPVKVVLMTTVQDYHGYGYIASQVCHRHNACIRCMDDTTWVQLNRELGSSKTVYMGQD
jgi:hypothetical protein